MARNFSRNIHFDKQTVNAVFIPRMRQDGLYYEVNIVGIPRFHMTWTALGRYDIFETDIALSYSLVLAISDILEEERKKL